MFVEEKAKGEVPDFKLGTLRLSTALRIGAGKRGQCPTVLFDGKRSCAIGAILEARGFDLDTLEGTPENQFGNVLLALVPELRHDAHLGNDLWDGIAYRNDHGDTREEIADWLESQGL